MKNVISFAIFGLLAFASFSFTGCGGGGDNKVVELEGTSPPPMPDDVKRQYEEAMKKAYSKSGPGN